MNSSVIRKLRRFASQSLFLTETYLTGHVPLYDGEFGYELLLQVPYANYLFKAGRLRSTLGLSDTHALYFFSPDHQEVKGSRSCSPYRGWNRTPHSQFIFRQWLPPDFRSYYQNSEFVFEKPICIIHNKYTMEWGEPPVNFISLQVLSSLFESLSKRFQIIYIRPGGSKFTCSDHQATFEFADFDLIKSNFPSVKTLQDLLDQNPAYSWNDLQFKLHSNCQHFISVQGGNSVLASYFGGTNIIFAKKGQELVVNAFDRLYPKLSGCNIYSFNDEILFESAVLEHYK